MNGPFQNIYSFWAAVLCVCAYSSIFTQNLLFVGKKKILFLNDKIIDHKSHSSSWMDGDFCCCHL